MSAAPDIQCAPETDREGWDAYVRGHSAGSFFHLTGWGAAVRAAYGYEPLYITARRGGALCGVLALSDARAPLLGRSLAASAFTVGGGPLADDAQTLAALLNEAERQGAARKANYIECRSDFAADGWREKTNLHAGFTAPLIADEAKALAAIPRKRRAEIRKAIALVQSGALTIRHSNANTKDADIFYRLYAHSLHRLGTPVFSRKFLNAVLATFGDDTEISVIDYQGAPVAALVSFYYNGAVLPYYVGANDAARPARAFDYLYWAVMRRAVERGCETFDFGRSKIDSGAYAYKKLWGFEPQPLTYRVKLIGADNLPDVNPNNPKFALFARAWPRLPGPIANRLGPLLAPNFP